MSLPSSESKLPGTTEPVAKPLSSRTPGPLGASKRVILPGVGR